MQLNPIRKDTMLSDSLEELFIFWGIASSLLLKGTMTYASSSSDPV
jgi:hypothetical protein